MGQSSGRCAHPDALRIRAGLLLFCSSYLARWGTKEAENVQAALDFRAAEKLWGKAGLADRFADYPPTSWFSLTAGTDGSAKKALDDFSENLAEPRSGEPRRGRLHPIARGSCNKLARTAKRVKWDQDKLRHAVEIIRSGGATDAVPETIEASLQLSEAALVGLGIAAGQAIASIHEKRDEFRRALQRASGCLKRNACAGLARTGAISEA